MINTISTDAFLFNGGFLQGYSMGMWHKEQDVTKEELVNGIMFPPNCNLTWTVFMDTNPNLSFAVTHIDKQGLMHSYINMTYQGVIEKIRSIITDVYNNNLRHIGIYQMIDAIKFDDYVEILE